MLQIIKIIKKHLFPNKVYVTRAHLIQSAIAGIYIFFVFWGMNSFHSQLAVASLGASTFIAFSFPANSCSRPRFLIGGYCVGTVSGLICSGFLLIADGLFPIPGYIPACALAVFLSMLIMTILNFEHPPSAALAVAITTAFNPFLLGLAGLGCIIVLCVLKELLKTHLHNL